MEIPSAATATPVRAKPKSKPATDLHVSGVVVEKKAAPRRKKPAAATSTAAEIVGMQQAPQPDAATLASMIAMAAYYRAEQRGFAVGHAIDDWLAAESEVMALLNS